MVAVLYAYKEWQAGAAWTKPIMNNIRVPIGEGATVTALSKGVLMMEMKLFSWKELVL